VSAGQLRGAVMAHQPDDGSRQWYVDEHVIDCDADEFWAVIARALAGETGRRP
jgi:hypothetical protein